jgi:hypothetical protein
MKKIHIFILLIVLSISLVACSNPNTEQPPLNKNDDRANTTATDTFTFVVITQPKVLKRKTIEVYENNNEIVVIQDEKLIKCELPNGGISYVRYSSSSNTVSSLLKTKLPENYCFELVCTKGESSESLVLVSFTMREMGPRK